MIDVVCSVGQSMRFSDDYLMDDLQEEDPFTAKFTSFEVSVNNSTIFVDSVVYQLFVQSLSFL